MADIIKTWPAFMDRKLTVRIFRRNWAQYFFTIGKGKPKQEIRRLYFTHKGEIIGYFVVDKLVINDGSLPKLSRLDGGESEWQIKPDRWVAICSPPFHFMVDEKAWPVYHEAFRGFRYFDFDAYILTDDAKFNIERE